jgi:hypothetical protein
VSEPKMMSLPDDWTPLSVRDGNGRKRIAWWVKGRREALALKLAPWLTTQPVTPTHHFHIVTHTQAPPQVNL